jgi:hypothetical protein
VRPAGGSFGAGEIITPHGLYPTNLQAAISARKAYLVFRTQGKGRSIQLSRGP